MALTTDPSDPRLTWGIDTEARPQAAAYLVLSDEERARGFVRPVRLTYIHAGIRPEHPTHDLTDEERERYAAFAYVAFEPYPEERAPRTGRFWTRAQLTSGCGRMTTMAHELAETYARDPKFYGATYCFTCRRHVAVEECRWVEADGTVGPRVGT